MTVSTLDTSNKSVADGISTMFTFDFALNDSGDISVYFGGALQPAGWSITSTVPGVGGTITFVTPPVAGTIVLIARIMVPNQLKTLPLVGSLSSATIVGMSDKLTMLVQQAFDDLSRTLQADITLTGVDLTFPAPGAGWLLRYNAAGTALEVVDPATILIGGDLPAPADGELLIWNGTTLTNITVAALNLLIPTPAGNVVNVSGATQYQIPIYANGTGQLIDNTLAIGAAGQKLASQGAGLPPHWVSDSSSVLPAELGKVKNQTLNGGAVLAVKLSNGRIVQGGQATYTARGIDNGTCPFGVLDWDSVHPPAAGATIVDWAYNEANIYVVMSNGDAYAAGQNVSGQLGQGNTTAKYILTRVSYFNSNALLVTKVFCTPGGALGQDSVFFVTSANKIYACGQNNTGQLGTNDTVNKTTPVLVYNAAGNTIVDLQTQYSGVGFTAFILSDGSLRMTGNNASGQLGQGNHTQLLVFTVVGGIANATAIQLRQASGSANMACVTSAAGGSLYVWGANGSYQGANGGTVDKDSSGAALLTGAINFGFFGLGAATSVWALLTGGNLYTWGYNGTNCIFAAGTAVGQTPVKHFAQTAVAVWGLTGSSGAGGGNLYVIDNANVMRMSGVSNSNCAFPSIADPDYASGSFRCSLPFEVQQGTDAISDLIIQQKLSSTNHTMYMLTAAGSLYGGGYSADFQITNWGQQLPAQPNRIFNHRLNRYLWGV